MAETRTEPGFASRVWIVTGIVSLTVVLLWLLKTIFSVLLLVLAGSLIALFFHALAGWIERKTGWSSKVSLLISTIGTFLLIIAVCWLIGAKVQAQIAQLSDTLPVTIDKTRSYIESSLVGKKVIDHLSSSDNIGKARGIAGSLFSTTFGLLGDLYVVIFLALFFTVSPKLYTKGFIRLLPDKGREKGRIILGTIGDDLRKWLKGKLFAMLVVFILTAIGLIALGVPMWLTLALIAGMLNFIPNFGPLLAMIPAVLVGFMQGINTSLLIIGLYTLIQVVESNLITPSVQKKLIEIPPALIIIAQLVMGVLTGGWGIVLATPLFVILKVIVEKTYLESQAADRE